MIGGNHFRDGENELGFNYLSLLFTDGRELNPDLWLLFSSASLRLWLTLPVKTSSDSTISAKLQDLCRRKTKRGTVRFHFAGPNGSKFKWADRLQILFNYSPFYNSKLLFFACCLFNFLRGFTNYAGNEHHHDTTALLSPRFSICHFL